MSDQDKYLTVGFWGCLFITISFCAMFGLAGLTLGVGVSFLMFSFFGWGRAQREKIEKAITSAYQDK